MLTFWISFSINWLFSLFILCWGACLFLIITKISFQFQTLQISFPICHVSVNFIHDTFCCTKIFNFYKIKFGFWSYILYLLAKSFIKVIFYDNNKSGEKMIFLWFFVKQQYHFYRVKHEPLLMALGFSFTWVTLKIFISVDWSGQWALLVAGMLKSFFT